MVLQLSVALILTVGDTLGEKGQEYVPTVETLAVVGVGSGKHCVLHIIF